MEQQFIPPPAPRFPVGKRELSFGILTAALCVGLWNSILYGGFNSGYALFSLALLGSTLWFLKSRGCRFGHYERSLLVWAAALIAGFARSSDASLKAVALPASLLAANLSFCLASGQNRRNPGGFATLFDAPRAFFTFGFGGMGAAVRGLEDARKRSGTAGKKGSAALLGIAIAIPVVAVMLPLLIRADAAFEGFMGQLPETDWSEPFFSLVTGLFAAWILFARGLGLCGPNDRQKAEGLKKRLSAITVNILLGAVSVLYCAYLFSQLGYFSGGFRWFLPEEYTLAEYARRGFFEMAWLSAINLTLILLCSALVERENRLPGLTMGLCFFLGAVTMFLIAAASAKMLLYIDAYGLTRLRLLTQTVMLWLAVTTVLVALRLLKPRFGYMKPVLLTALALLSALLWLDVDTCVARYNVRAYQEGRLETVDMDHMAGLGYGALPYVQELTQDPDAAVSWRAKTILSCRDLSEPTLRSWNYSRARAAALTDGNPDWKLLTDIGRKLDLELTLATLEEYRDTHGGFHGDGETFARIRLTEDAAGEAVSRMLHGGPWWKALPLTEELDRVLYGTGTEPPLFHDENGDPLLPEIKKGWYFFYDQQGDPYIEESLFSRPSFNFSLAIFDKETGMLYYFDLDT